VIDRGREQRFLVVSGALLAVSVAAHLPYVLSGTQTFWIGVTLAMAAFCFVSSAHLLGWANAVAFLSIGAALGLFFEASSVHTGFPFGPYYYTDVFGPGVFGVPYIIPLAWYVIVYLAYVIANLMIERQPVVVGGAGQSMLLAFMGAAVVTAYDLSLDPFMVTRIKAWVMENPGSYFGEQFRGFGGWMLTSFLISIVFRLTRRRMPPSDEVSPIAVLYPLAAYGLWGAFFALAGEPPATRAIAVFAMGIPTLAAASGFVKWRQATRSQGRAARTAATA
jgi:putative membrane protein